MNDEVRGWRGRVASTSAAGVLLALAACAAPTEGPGPAQLEALPAPSAEARVHSRGVDARRAADGSLSLTIDGVVLAVRGGADFDASPLGVHQRVRLDRREFELAIDLPPTLRLVRPPGYMRVVDVVDGRGVPRARVRVDDEAITLEPDGSSIRISARGADLPFAILDWTSTGAPLAIRTHHTATLLPTGDVLFAGGISPLTATATTEIFDATSGQFRAGPPMKQSRADHSATMRDDGRVLMAGGDGPLDSTEWFDALDGEFVPGPKLTVPRAGQSAVRLNDGRTLFVGGAGSTAEVLDAAGTQFSVVGSTAVLPGEAAALLDDGRVAVAASPIQLFDPSTDTFSSGPPCVDGLGVTATRTPMGEVIFMGLCAVGGCTIGGAVPPQQYGVLSADGASLTQFESPFVRSRASASILPSGEILFTGGLDFSAAALPPTLTVSSYGVLPPGISAVAQLDAGRSSHTATLLPSGSTLVVGTAASVDLFLPREVQPQPFGLAVGLMQSARADPAAVTLFDGKALVVGGTAFDVCLASAETLLTGDVLPSMHEARAHHTLTLLPDGRVLAVGGECDGAVTAEIYDPDAFTWTLVGAPASGRSEHSATLLFDGRVLVAGGYDANHAPLSSTEIFDPSTNTFTPGPSDPSVEGAHGATILPSGRVLFVVADRAGIFDPATDQFARSLALGAAYEAPTTTLLPSGKVLIAGKLSPNGAIYDDATEHFSFTGPLVRPVDHHQAILLPSGRVALIGGLTPPAEVMGDDSVQIFDALAEGGLGGFIAGQPLLFGGRGDHRLLLGEFGDVLVIGGSTCQNAGCPRFDFDSFGTWREPSDSSVLKPQLDQVVGTATPGTDVLAMGSSFRGLAGSSGTARASDGGFPIAIWQSALYGGRAIGTLHDVGPTGATWRVPSTPFRGPGVLRVSTNALLSRAVPVTIGPAPSGHACSGPHECATGFCADGFCCDRACDGACEACAAAKNGSGTDGVCAPIPPGFASDDACVIGKGGGCASDAECATGFCVDGVCCESRCDQQCEACDVSGSPGECTAVVGAPHADRPACATAADACANAICDGLHRDACEAVVGPCEPYACGASACETTCDPSIPMGPGSGCALNFRCTKEGICVPRQATCDGHLSTSRDGEVVDCAPYNCQTDGTCREACGSVLDCADPFVCDPSGHCVARGAESPGDGCALASGAGSGAGALLSAALAACGIARLRARNGGRRPERRRT